MSESRLYLLVLGFGSTFLNYYLGMQLVFQNSYLYKVSPVATHARNIAVDTLDKSCQHSWQQEVNTHIINTKSVSLMLPTFTCLHVPDIVVDMVTNTFFRHVRRRSLRFQCVMEFLIVSMQYFILSNVKFSHFDEDSYPAELTKLYQS